MHEYQLHIDNKFEEFIPGININIMATKGMSEYRFVETKDGTVFFIKFYNEDEMYAFDKYMRDIAPFLFQS
ncbi:hypothetical protein [Flavobacterium wongokense]|uniref:hypothetical protein n=1 Tax=Flavobacterium wongokense TaxID=2910674 RepID=UPI001F31655F|nr:hypothetical protein [Flavobacterium sp. WG47]MCF6133444.1 hypothetical protein [Flavobacterium sp. WG47]